MNATEADTTDLPTLLRRLERLLAGFSGVVPALLTRREAAAYLGLSEGMVRLMRKRGELPGCAVRVGRAVRYRRSALDRIIGRLPPAK